MTTFRRLSMFAVLGLLAGWFAAGCAGSSQQTADDSAAADDAGETVACSRLENEADSGSEDSGSTDQLPLRATGPVATVDGTDISADAFNRFALRRMPTQHRKMAKPLADRMKRKMTHKLVERHIIQRTLDDGSITVEKSALESRFLDFKSRFPDDEAFQAFLDQRQITKQQLKAQLCRDVQTEKYLEKHYHEGVSDEDVSDYYENNKSEFRTPEKVKASHILLRVPDDASPDAIERKKKKARTLAEKARKEGTDFANLAEKHSDGPSAKRGGDLGFFSRRRMVGEFSEVAFSMDPGEVSDPVRTKFGFHVIKMHEKQQAKTQSLEEARDEIERRLQQQSRRTSMHRFLEETKQDLSIEYHLDNIETNMQTAEAGGGSDTLPTPPGSSQ